MINAIDIAFAVIVLLMLLTGVIRGFALTLIGMLRFIAALPLSVYVSGKYSDMVYEGYVRDYVVNKLTERINELGSAESFADSLSQKNSLVGDIILDSIPSSQLRLFEPAQLAASLTDNFLRPMLQDSVKLLLFIAVLFAFYLVTSLVMLIIKKTRKRDRSPLRTADRVFGGVLGLVKAVLAVGVISIVLTLFASLDSTGSNEFVKLINDSAVVSFLSNTDLTEIIV